MWAAPEDQTIGPRRAVSRPLGRRFLFILLVAAALGLLLTVAAFRVATLAGELGTARSEILAALNVAQRHGVAIASEDVLAMTQSLRTADDALTRAAGQLRGDPVILFLSGMPVAGRQITAVESMVAGARQLTRSHETTGQLLSGFIVARDVEDGPERLASLARFLAAHQQQISRSLDGMMEADDIMTEIGGDGLIGPVASAHATLTERLAEVRPLISAAQNAAPVLPSILGVGSERRYLVVALDNAELRPIGGLIAAFATPRFTDGLLQDHTFRDILSVDLAGQEEFVEPPVALIDHLLGEDNPWQVADAGWWPDFADNAAEARRLFEIETGDDNFQGAIAFTPEFVDGLLEVIGPVEVADAGITVHAGETYLVSLEQVEVLNRGEGRKQFLADLASEVLDRLFALPPERYPEVVAAFDAAGKRRQLQMQFDDPAAQELITRMGWYTPFAFPEGTDRLSIMEANVSPVSKLSVLLDLHHELDVTLQSDGSAHERLVTTFTNRYGPELPPELERVRSTFFDGNLGSLHRRYLDPDAEINEISSDDPEVPVTDPGYLEGEAGGLSVGNYQLLAPGTTRLTTEYFVPNVIRVAKDTAAEGTYRLDFFKQPGRDLDTLEVHVTVPPGTVPLSWSNGGTRSGRTVSFLASTEFDRVFEVRFGLE